MAKAREVTFSISSQLGASGRSKYRKPVFEGTSAATLSIHIHFLPGHSTEFVASLTIRQILSTGFAVCPAP
jgi:hypothetical protein